MAFSLKNKTETALGITNSTILIIFFFFTLFSFYIYQNLNRLSQKEEEAWGKGGWSLAGLAFAELTVDKQNHKVSRLSWETKERSGKGLQPSPNPSV